MKFIFILLLFINVNVFAMWGGSSNPKISIDADVSKKENNNITFTAKLDDDPDDDWWFEIDTADDTAISEDDYTSQDNKRYNCSKDSRTCDFTVEINNDDLYEDDETFKVKIVDHSDNVDDGTLEKTGTIENDDNKPTLSWNSNNKTVDETDDDFNTTMTLQLDAKSGLDTTVTLKFTDGSAKKKSDDTDDEINDYDTPQESVVIPAGSTEVDFNTTIIGETKKDSQKVEDFNVTIDSADNADIDSDDTRTISINDDESIDTVYVVNKTVSESDGDITVSIKINGGATQALDVDWALDDDSADTDDYTDNSGTVHFDVGDTEKTITVNIKDDDIAEDEEKFKVNLTQDDTSDTHYVDGYVTIKESDRLVIVGDTFDYPSSNENNSPMKVKVRLVDPNEKAKNDIKIDLQSNDDTAIAGDDYDSIDDTLTISAGDNGVEDEITIIDDEEEEDTERFDLNLTCNSCGNVEIKEDGDSAYIIDNDIAPSLTTGEFNDIDNYYLRDEDGNKIGYKRIFCTPLSHYDKDNGKIYIQNDGNLTQILETKDGNISYDRLFATNITLYDNATGDICREGTTWCKSENLQAYADTMDVNESWFDKTQIGDYVSEDIPGCSDEDDVVDLYNVDEDGKQIWWKKKGEWGPCTINFKIRDENYTKPFLIEYIKTYDNNKDAQKTTFNMAPAAYFFKDVKFDGKAYIHINDEDYPDAPYDIIRFYVQSSEHKSNGGGYVFSDKSVINYEDCNGDGNIDKGDITCQDPSKFFFWYSSKDDSTNIFMDTIRMAGYFYGAGEGDSTWKFGKDEPGDGKFVTGAVTGLSTIIDKNSKLTLYWKKANKDIKYFVGDFDKCLYTPTLYLNGEDKKFRENEAEDADINMSILYVNDATRKALCENDWNISFDFKIAQRYTDDDDEEGNATQDVDYSAKNYDGNIQIKRKCPDCAKESCWHDTSVSIGDFDVKEDKIEEPNELFDFNLSNAVNVYFGNADSYENSKSDDNASYLMTIIDIAPPQTITGLFDAYDLFRADKENDNSGKIGDDSDEDRNISVKISGKKFGLTLGVFDPAYSDTLKKTDENVTAKYKVVYCPEENTTDASDCKELSNTIYESAEEQLQMFFSNKHTEQDINITTDDSHQNVAVRFEVCSLKQNDGTLELYPYSDCMSSNGCKDEDGNNQKCYRYILSTDKFTIRPDKLKLSMSETTDLKSANDFNITMKAVQYDSNDKVDDNYTVKSADKNYTIVQSIYKNPTNSSIDTALNGTVTFPESFDMTDGNVTTKITFNDVGKVHIQIIDKTWAKIDEDVSPADCSENGTWICGEINATFIPDHFDITNGEIKNNGGEVYTYITDDINNTSATLSLKITAKNKNGDTTKNFQDNNWENEINATFNVADSTSTTDINESNNTRNELKDANLDFNNGEATIEHNNTKLSFNYERNNSKAINPFKVDGSNIVTTIMSGYSTKVITGSSSMSNNATFIYPKVYAPRYKYTGNTGDAYISVLDYCDGSGCDKSLLPDGTNSKTMDDPRWFINTKHKAKYGKVNEVKEKHKTNVTVTALTDENPNTKTSLELNGSIKKVYKTTMEINASKWLIYNKYDENKKYNEFNVEFYNGSTGWAGVHDTNTTTKKSGSSTSHSRLMW